MQIARISLLPTVFAALALALIACEGGTATNAVTPRDGPDVRNGADALPTIPSPTTYSPTTTTPNQVKLCKDASSPAGTYTFTISSDNSQAGDQVGQSAVLLPGQCTIIFNRTGHTYHSGTFTLVYLTEVIPVGASYRVKYVEGSDRFGSGRVNPPIGRFSVAVNGYHGAVVNYANEVVPAG